MAILYLKGLDNSGFQLGLERITKPLSDDQKEKISKLMIATWSNMAACYLKLEQFDKVIETCDKVLSKDEKNIKSMFRKGQALFGLNDLDQAVKVLKATALLEPKDVGIRQELQKVRDRLVELDKRSTLELKQNLSKANS